jgi:hypothetical protein
MSTHTLLRAEKLRAARAKRSAAPSPVPVKLDAPSPRHDRPKPSAAKDEAVVHPTVKTAPAIVALGPGERLYRAIDLSVVPIVATISALAVEGIPSDDGIQARPVARLVASNRALVLNATNLQTITAAFGEDQATWIGRTIEIYQGDARFAGRRVPAIRLRAVEAEPRIEGAQP